MMTARTLLPGALHQPGMRVHTLILIRWIAVLGQSFTLLLVAYGLDFSFPRLAAAGVVAASMTLNLALSLFYRPGARIAGREAFSHLLFDLCQLSALLYLTGGLHNPFCILLLAPVAVSASLLSATVTLALALCAISLVALLFHFSLPLPWEGAPPLLPGAYRIGQAIALGFTLIFIAVYALRLSLEARRWQLALAATQNALERETKISALGALAAAAAHELGGPLGTITLVASDLNAQLGEDPDFGEDIALLQSEAARARAILTRIAQRTEAEDAFALMSLAALLHEVAAPHAHARVPILIAVAGSETCLVRRTPELVHGLANLLDNAVRHAKTEVRLDAQTDSDGLHITICDDGEGFANDLLPRLGDPWPGPSLSRQGSTGLGIFIATTLLQRTGARINFDNVAGAGAQISLSWPHEALLVAQGVADANG